MFYLVKEGELVLYSSCFKCFPAQFINQFCSACFAAVVIYGESGCAFLNFF